MQDFTAALYNLRQAFAALNPEMKMFNENITKSNEFLGRIAKLQRVWKRKQGQSIGLRGLSG